MNRIILKILLKSSVKLGNNNLEKLKIPVGMLKVS